MDFFPRWGCVGPFYWKKSHPQFLEDLCRSTKSEGRHALLVAVIDMHIYIIYIISQRKEKLYLATQYLKGKVSTCTATVVYGDVNATVGEAASLLWGFLAPEMAAATSAGWTSSDKVLLAGVFLVQRQHHCTDLFCCVHISAWHQPGHSHSMV